MAAHPPPVPPAERQTVAGDDNRPIERAGEAAKTQHKAADNEQDRQGAIHQATTHPGYQQDR